jgi:hypothetical protein
MNDKDTALRLALEALEQVNVVDDDCDILAPSLADAVVEAITEVKAALETSSEPVAWRTYTGRGYYIIDKTLEEAERNWPDRPHSPLYTTPPPVAEPHKRPSRSDITWQSLTDEDWRDVANETDRIIWPEVRQAIEAKLKEKNT